MAGTIGHLDYFRNNPQNPHLERGGQLNETEIAFMLSQCDKVKTQFDNNISDPDAFTWYFNGKEVAESKTIPDGSTKLVIFSGPTRQNQVITGELAAKLIK